MLRLYVLAALVAVTMPAFGQVGTPSRGSSVILREADGTELGSATVKGYDEETGLATLTYNVGNGNLPLPDAEIVAVFERRL